MSRGDKRKRRDIQDVQLDEDLTNALNPCEEKLMKIDFTPESVKELDKWYENIKIKLIVQKAQAAADGIVENAELGFTTSKIVTPKVDMKSVKFKCAEEGCDYENCPVSMCHHYFSNHYQYIVYVCRLCPDQTNFDTYGGLQVHVCINHNDVSKKEKENQYFRHRYVRRVYQYLKEVCAAAHEVLVMYSPPTSPPSRSTDHNKISKEERTSFLQIFNDQNDWRLESIFNKKMPVFSMKKDVTVLLEWVKYKDRKNKDFPSQYIYMYPSYKLVQEQPIISFTIGCGQLLTKPSGNYEGWNAALKKSCTTFLRYCASAARVNDNKGNDDGAENKELSFILPQFTIIIYWTRPGTDIEGNDKSSNISIKMDGRNFLAKDFETFFVALYSRGKISSDAAAKMKCAILGGVKEIELKVQEYLQQAENIK